MKERKFGFIDTSGKTRKALKRLAEMPILQQGEAEELIRIYRETSDDIVRNKLILAYQPLVIKIAHYLAKKWNGDVAALIADGYIGLDAAIKTFDSRKGNFTTHAYHAIRWYINTALRRDRLVRIPENAFANKENIPSYALTGGMSIEDFGRTASGEKRDLDTLGIFAEKLSDEDSTGAKEKIDRLLKTNVLSDREKEILRQYYFQEKTLREIGDETRLSTERVRQIMETALRKCRKYFLSIDGTLVEQAMPQKRRVRRIKKNRATALRIPYESD